MSTRKIKRTWWSKKQGKYITKIYEYETVKTASGKVTTKARSRRSKLIIGKNGVYEDRLQDLLAAAPDVSVRAEIKAKVRESLRKGEKLSVKSLLSKISESKIEKAFINAGYTEEEILDEIGISRSDLFNEKNWDGSVFTYGGNVYDFQFSYTGNVLVKR